MSRSLACGLALLGLLAVAMTACGGGDKNDATKSPTAAPASATAAGATPGSTAPGTPATGGDASAIEALIRRQTDANNNKDVDAFVAAFAESYYADLGVSRDDARALVTTFIGVPQVDITSVSSIEVSGDRATAQVDSNEGVFLSSEKYSFVREAGQWRVAKIDELPVQADTANAVDMSLVEYSFAFDAGALSDGEAVFNVRNNGAQAHEVELLKLPAGADAQGVRDREDLPAGVETVGLFGPLDPGESRVIAFSQKLAPGNYAVVCYLSDPSGQPHSAIGMVKDVTVN